MPATYRDAMRAALLYLLLSVVWLKLSGYLSNSFFDSSDERLRWQLINGYVWVVLSAGLIFIARARLFRCLGIGAELRERNEDRERLRQAAAVFDCTREGVLVTDRHGIIVHVNRAFMEITGYQTDECWASNPVCSSPVIIRRVSTRRCSPHSPVAASGAVKSGIAEKVAKSIRNGRRFA